MVLSSPTTPQWLPESSDIISTMVLCCGGPINSNRRPRTNIFNLEQPVHGSRMVPCENFLTMHCITIGNPLLCIRESLTMHYIIAYRAMDRLSEIEFVRSRPSDGVDRTTATWNHRRYYVWRLWKPLGGIR